MLCLKCYVLFESDITVRFCFLLLDVYIYHIVFHFHNNSHSIKNISNIRLSLLFRESNIFAILCLLDE